MFGKVNNASPATNGEGEASRDHPVRMVASLGRVQTLRRGDVLAKDPDEDVVYIVKSGTLLVQSLFGGGRRQVLAFRFACDLLCTSFNHNLPETSAQAVTDLEVLGVARDALANRAGCEPLLTDTLIRTTGMQMQRCWVQHLLLGRLNAVERLSSFVLELARGTRGHTSQDAHDAQRHR